MDEQHAGRHRAGGGGPGRHRAPAGPRWFARYAVTAAGIAGLALSYAGPTATAYAGQRLAMGQQAAEQVQPTGPGYPALTASTPAGTALLAVTGPRVGVRSLDARRAPAVLGAKELPGGGVYGPTALVADAATGRTLLFARGSGDRGLYYQWKLGAGAWQGWRRVPAAPVEGSAPTAVISGDRVDLFYAGADAVIRHQVLTGLTLWSAPEVLPGGTYGSIGAYRVSSAAFRLWVVGTNGLLYAATGWTGHWPGWSRAGDGRRLTGGPAAVTGFQPGREDVFAVGSDGLLYEGTWTAGLGRFAGWTLRDGAPHDGDAVAAVVPGAGRLVVASGNGYRLTYAQYLSGRWTAFRTMP